MTRLTEFLGKSELKVLDVLFVWNGDFYLKEIIDKTGMSRVATTDAINRLEKYGIVIKVREVGRAKMYKLTKSKRTKYLRALTLADDDRMSIEPREKEIHKLQTPPKNEISSIDMACDAIRQSSI